MPSGRGAGTGRVRSVAPNPPEPERGPGRGVRSPVDVLSDLLLDSGTFHDLSTDQRNAMGRSVTAVAAPSGAQKRPVRRPTPR